MNPFSGRIKIKGEFLLVGDGSSWEARCFISWVTLGVEQFIKRLPGFIYLFIWTFSISRGGPRIIGAAEDWDPPLHCTALETPPDGSILIPISALRRSRKCVWGVQRYCCATVMITPRSQHLLLHYIFAHLAALQSLSLSAAISWIIEWEYYEIEIVIENFTPALRSLGVVSIKSISLHFITNSLDALRCKQKRILWIGECCFCCSTGKEVVMRRRKPVDKYNLNGTLFDIISHLSKHLLSLLFFCAHNHNLTLSKTD